MFPAHQGHLYLLISAPKGCILVVYFSAQRVHMELLIPAPKEFVLLLIFLHKRVRLDLLITAPKRRVLLLIFCAKGCKYIQNILVVVVYYLIQVYIIFCIPPIELWLSLQDMNWTNEGMVKRIRGMSFSTRVLAQFENAMIHPATGIFNRLRADVQIYTTD